jgi:hypothetical protein
VVVKVVGVKGFGIKSGDNEAGVKELFGVGPIPFWKKMSWMIGQEKEQKEGERRDKKERRGEERRGERVGGWRREGRGGCSTFYVEVVTEQFNF